MQYVECRDQIQRKLRRKTAGLTWKQLRGDGVKSCNDTSLSVARLALMLMPWVSSCARKLLPSEEIAVGALSL
jgi:hypothetical protein